jgi:hypothetical protein
MLLLLLLLLLSSLFSAAVSDTRPNLVSDEVDSLNRVNVHDEWIIHPACGLPCC